MRQVCITLFLATFCSGLYAQEKLELFIHDSLGVVCLHQTRNGDTYYGIGQIYGSNIHLIKQANPQINGNSKPVPNKKIIVPIKKENLLARKPLFASHDQVFALNYTVRPKDNVFRICRVYFDLPMPYFKKKNDIDGENLSIGQKVFVGWLKKGEYDMTVLVGDRLDVEPNLPFASNFDQQLVDFPSALLESKEICVKDETGTKGLFVLHKLAKIGSYIEIVNPVTHKTAYAKVLGALPEQLYAKEISMVVSQELAKQLGILDARSFLRTRFIKP